MKTKNERVAKAKKMMAVFLMLALVNFYSGQQILADEIPPDQTDPPVETEITDSGGDGSGEVLSTEEDNPADDAPGLDQDLPDDQETDSGEEGDGENDDSVADEETSDASEDGSDDFVSSDPFGLEQQNGMSSDETSDENAAGDPSAQNEDTGPDSENVSETNVNNETDINNENYAQTLNQMCLAANTGENVANYNTGSGVITTQNAKGRGEIINVINRNQVILPGQEGLVAQANNSNTGPGSDNLAEVNINNELTVRNSNNSNTLNRLDAVVVSGKNSTSYNTNHGIVITGDARLGVNFISMANTNIVGSGLFYANWQNIYGNAAGTLNLAQEAATYNSPLTDMLIQAVNDCTGPGSSNQAIVNVNDEITISNQNSGNLKNEINASVISGKNKASANTGTGSIVSGNVDAAVNAVNFLNSNITASNSWFKILNVFGDWHGNIVMPAMPASNLQLGAGEVSVNAGNENTGPDSENETELNINSDFDLNNENQATINNDVVLNAIAGENLNSYNVSSAVTHAGEARSEVNKLNVANVNVTGDTWWMVVVNKFGSWTGASVGAPSDMFIGSSGISSVFAPVNSGLTLGNVDTGPGSDNTAEINVNQDVDIDNLNIARIDNRIHLDAVTGQNETQFNTGHGYIETGDIEAAANIVNFANANITVGNWLVAVINVFGDWVGDLVFNECEPGQENNGGGPGGNIASGNYGTGAGSSNNSVVNDNTNTNIDNNNNSNVNNNTDANSNTGQNSASYNTGNGVITTGGADTTSGISNLVNANIIALGDGGDGNITAGNAGTGPGSDNDSTVNSNNQTDINNNNDANVNNNYKVNNNTGNNSADYNTGNGVVDTGWAETFLQLRNEFNENQITMGDLQEDFEDPDEPGNDPDPIPTPTPTPTPTPGAPAPVLAAGGGGGGVSLPRPLRGDLNGDGKVNDFDLSILMANWGKKMKNKSADINNDGKVNDFDLSILLANWNRISSIA